jgi:hypothetical protein
MFQENFPCRLFALSLNRFRRLGLLPLSFAHRLPLLHSFLCH